MKKNLSKLSFMIGLLALSLTWSCKPKPGESSSLRTLSGQQGAADAESVRLAESVSELPKCDSARKKQVYFVVNLKQYKQCRWHKKKKYYWGVTLTRPSKTLVLETVASSGQCPFGGTRIRLGTDMNTNNKLEGLSLIHI